MEKKKVMILGAANGQLPFIKICKDNGYYVIVVSIKGNYPGFEFADKSYYYDTRDKESILKAAKHEGIDAILTDQTDASVQTVAYVSEKLGLRGIGYNTSLKFTNKYEMRKAAKDAGVPVPEFEEFNNVSDAVVFAEKIGFPLMLKPVDSSGSRGVSKIDNIDELKDRFSQAQKFSSNGYVILEQFITGIPFIVNGFAIDGEYYNLDIANKSYFKSIDLFITRRCIFESACYVDNEIKKTVLKTNKQLVEGIGLNAGITHADYLYNEKEKKAYLVEIAARGGGTFISSNITPMVTGFNSNKALIDYIVEGIITKLERPLDKVSGYACFALPEGVIESISGIEELSNMKSIKMLHLNDLYVGKRVSGLTHDAEKYGPIIFLTESIPEAEEVIKTIEKTLDIRVITDDGIKGIIW